MGKFNDLTGQKFGRLTVLSQFYKGKVKYCKCECSCSDHTIKDINASNLVRGLTKSCGCLAKEVTHENNFKSVIGQEINGFTILDEYVDESYKHKVTCKCIYCGKESIFLLSSLQKAKVHKCSCTPRFTNPLKGKIVGRWNVLDDLYNDKHEHICLCRCSCDKHTEKYVSHHNLVKGISKSCGCLIREAASKRFISHVGERYGFLVVTKDFMDGKRHICECDCDCGNKKTVLLNDLKNGSTKSCGHYHTQRSSETSVKDLAGKVFGNLTVLYRSGTNSWGGVIWKCYCSCCGNEADIYGQALLNGTTSCGCKSIAVNGSRDELEIKEYIKSISNLEGKKIRNLEGKEIDLFYEDFNIGIEFNGSFYHSTINPRFESKPKNYHQQKFLLAKEKGIHLINIFDVDWWNNQDRIKMYLSYLFLPKEKIFARKCRVENIDKSIADGFFDLYHLQGRTHFGTINYGLYCKDELVAVMSFGKLRLKKQAEGHYELHRYAVMDGYNIVGGASKLLTHFERDYTPKYLISYSDNDYFVGGIYSILGFADVGQTTPRYYWNKGREELKREKCQLKYLKVKYPELYQEAVDNNASNKEDYIMASLGYCKVYRSGNTRWEKTYETI